MTEIKVGKTLMNGGAPHRTATVMEIDKSKGTVSLQWSDESDLRVVPLEDAKKLAPGKRMANFNEKLKSQVDQQTAEEDDDDARYGYLGP